MKLSVIRQKIWLTLLISVIIVLLSSLIRELFFSGLGRGIPYLTYYPAVMFAAILGGLPGGFTATGLSAVLAYFWIQQGQLHAPDRHQGIGAIVGEGVHSGILFNRKTHV